jgi:hypothetical protein
MTTRLTALAIGELTTVDNCLRVEDYLLVWPPEFVVNVEGDTVQIEDKLLGEKTVWRLGEVVQVGGGEVSFLGLTEDVRARIPAGCKGPYWLVGGWLTPTATVQPR